MTEYTFKVAPEGTMAWNGSQLLDEWFNQTLESFTLAVGRPFDREEVTTYGERTFTQYFWN